MNKYTKNQLQAKERTEKRKYTKADDMKTRTMPAFNNNMPKRERESLITDNVGLVKNILRKNFHITSESHLYDDMYQAGLLGLSIAANSFDVTKGVKFCTHAFWHIRQIGSRQRTSW